MIHFPKGNMEGFPEKRLTIRLFSENGVWDTGNYLEHRQPEEIIYYPETLEVRANWDVVETFGVPCMVINLVVKVRYGGLQSPTIS